MKTSTFYYLLTFLFISSISHSQEYIEASRLIHFLGENIGDRFGNGNFAGDVNGDGYDDIIIRGHYNDQIANDAGKAYIYLGGTSFDNIVDFELYGEAPEDHFSAVISTAGDINNDGFDDIIVGASLADAGNQIDAGKAYVYLGNTKLDTSPDLVISGNPYDRLSIVSNAGDLNGDGFDDFMVGTSHTDNQGYVNIYFGSENTDNIAELTLYEENLDDKFGSYLACAGDVNGDGYDDIIVSGYRNSSGASVGGRVYLYYGGQDMDNLPDVIFTGQESSGYLGWSVDGGGDVNGDGFDDIIIGAWAEDAGGHDNGNVYLFLGSTDMDNNPDVVFKGKLYEENFGKYVSNKGDINGDGFDDIIVGAAGTGLGRVYVYFGNANIIDQPDLIFSGENEGDNFGPCKFAGDLNSDGFGDIIIGADRNNDNGQYAGKSYMFLSNMIHETPIIIEQPRQIIVNEGETAIFEVHATCSDSIGYQWWKVPYISLQESKIVDIPGRIEGATTNQLQILNTTKNEDDNTKYLCEVYNTIDPENLWVNSEPVTLNVNEIEQVVKLQIECDTVWYDDNYDGVELGLIDASSSSVNFGSIDEFIWSVNGDTVGYGINPTIELATGTNRILLTALTDRGNIKQLYKSIDVYSAKLETLGELHSSVSWLNNKSLFISSTDDKIYKFDSTGTVAWTILTGGSILSTVCVLDEKNIYVGSTDTRLYVFDNNGAPKWDKAMGGVIYSSPSVGPDKSVYVGLNSGRLFSLNDEGTLNWSMQADGAIVSSPTITEEHVYFGSSDKNIYSISRENGIILNTYATDDTVISTAAISKDGNVFIGSNDGYLYKFDSDLNLIWKFYTLGKVTTSPVIDEIGNVYIGSSSGFIYALSSDRLLLWKYDAGSPITGNPSIGPNGNIFIGCDDGRLIVLNRNGKLMWNLQTNASIKAATLVSPNNIIYLPSTDGNVYIMKAPYFYYGFGIHTQPFEWPTYKGNYKRTGFISFDPVGVPESDNSVPKEFNLHQNFPNPFNPSTIINYSLVKQGHVKLSVYDLLGREIMVLVNKNQLPGNYSVSVDAGLFSSGVYIYQLETEGFIQSRKMILLK